MTTAIMMDKKNLLARLRAQREVAAVHDADALRRHKAAEKAYEKAFRAAAREASKWDYEQIKAKGLTRWMDTAHALGLTVDAPACPRPKAGEYDEMIKALELSKQQEFTLDNKGRHSYLHGLVMWDPLPKPKDLCG